MFTELSPSQFQSVRSLFSSLAFNIEVPSMLDGNTVGRIFTDDAVNPHAALAWDKLSALFIAGLPTTAPSRHPFEAGLLNLIEEEVLPLAKRYGIDALTLTYSPSAWAQVLSEMLDDYELTQNVRRYHTHNHVAQPVPDLPDGFQLQCVDPAILGRANLRGQDWLQGWILSFWPSVTHFLERGIGYVVLDRDRAVVSLCISVFVSGPLYELGTATHEPYRRRGFSSACVASCINEALSRGGEPIWHCWDDNHASVAVARKTGFLIKRRYRVLRLWTPTA